MAHMDSINSLDRRVRRHFKKVFNKLDDQFFIREPVLDDVKVAPLVIEGPNHTWLMLGWHEQQPTAEMLDRFTRLNTALISLNFQPIKYLAVIKDIAQSTVLLDSDIGNNKDLITDIIPVEQTAFYETGDELITQHLVKVSDEQYSRLKKKLFPESAIHSQCTTRRQTVTHDNSAKLHSYFLDYDQEQATRFDMLNKADESEELEDFSVRLINGVAGCGKTLILINRALLFCKKHPDKQVLLIIHNKPITADINHRIEHWLGGKPNNFTIQTFHAFALGQQTFASRRVEPLFGDKSLQPYKTQLFNDENETYKKLTLSDAQLWGELEYINEYLIKDQDEYLDYERQGRGFALKKSQRLDIWKLYEQAMAMMSSHQGYLPSLYIRELALLDDTQPLKKYHHILIDEAQFFAPSWLQLVKQSLHQHSSIFLCADPNQGFLKSRLSWKSVGFNVRGRTKKLSYSYRTTYEIMVAANALLAFMDESADDFIKPDLDRMQRGTKPHVIYSNTTQDEQKRFINELKQSVDQGETPLQQIMVLCSERYKPWSLKTSIEQALGHGTVVNCNNAKDMQQNLGGKIRLMSINSCTGMESGITFVLGVGELMNRAKNLDLEEDERELTYKESIRKLYVAMTRAGQKLVLFSTETLPECVDGLVECSGKEKP